MGIFLSYSCISTTVWLYHLNFNKTPGEKASWELYNDAAACCSEQIVEVAPYKTAAAQLLDVE